MPEPFLLFFQSAASAVDKQMLVYRERERRNGRKCCRPSCVGTERDDKTGEKESRKENIDEVETYSNGWLDHVPDMN